MTLNYSHMFSLDHLNLLHRLRQLPHQLLDLNLFIIPHKSSQATLSRERWTTRLYILLWLVTWIILIIYNSFAQETSTFHIVKPDEGVYNKLYSSYGDSLQCPCSSIAIAYNDFVEINTRLHPVCYSVFIDDIWINYISGDGIWLNVAKNDFRSHGVMYFLLLKALCASARRAIEKLRMESLNKQIFKGVLVPRQQLLSQISLFVDIAKNWNVDEFILFATVSHDFVYFSQLMNVFTLNWEYAPIPVSANLSYYVISTQPVSHGSNCSCATSSSCTEPSFLQNVSVPGFVLGCSPMGSLLRSSLACLYNAACIERINFGNLSSIVPLDATLSSHYSADSLVNDLILNSLIEEWSLNISYSTYFSLCRASFCSYSVSEKKPVLRVITLLLGLYGGLAFVLRSVTPWLVAGLETIMMTLLSRRNGRVVAFM